MSEQSFGGGDRSLPDDSVVYRHTETDDTVQYISRTDDTYLFSINGGERTTAVPTELWPDYREFLEVEGRV